MKPIETVILHNGREVLAKRTMGELWAVTYANETQAKRKIEQLGPGWTLTGFRPYYVTRERL